MEESIHLAINWIVETVAQWGYTGIFVMMCIESSSVTWQGRQPSTQFKARKKINSTKLVS